MYLLTFSHIYIIGHKGYEKFHTSQKFTPLYVVTDIAPWKHMQMYVCKCIKQMYVAPWKNLDITNSTKGVMSDNESLKFKNSCVKKSGFLK